MRHDDRCAGAATSSYQRWIVPCAGKLHVACAILVPRSQSSISGCGLSPFLPAPGLVLLPQPALQTMLCMHPSSSCGLGHHSGEEQSLCFLKASQSISVSRGSHFQAHFVWQVLGGSIITRFYIYEIKKLLEGGNSTGVQQSSMLGLYGERVCRTRNQTYLLWEAQEVQLSVLQCIYIYILYLYIIYYIYISIYICIYRYIHIWTFSKIGILVPKL